MEKCQAKDLLYNSKTKRCYKSCEQKKKVTHPVTKKCRKKCNPGKIRRTIDFRCVKPLEKLIPPPLEKEIVDNFNFINDLLKKGEKKVNIDFDSSLRVSEIITIYFHEKYKQACPMYPIKTYSEFETEDFKELYTTEYKHKMTKEQLKAKLLKSDKADYIDWNKEKFLKNLKLCLDTGEELIMVPLRISRHFNMLIIKVATREIIRFEPHGAYNTNEKKDTKTNNFLVNLTKDINSYLKLNETRKFSYIDPTQICPRYHPKLPLFYDGFQIMEGKGVALGAAEGDGFCQLWGWFFAECVINNPTLPIKEVYKEAYDTIRQDEMNFAIIIRGYFYGINEELLKMKKMVSIKGSTIKNLKGNGLLLEYLNQSRKKLQAKPRKSFVGGIKNSNTFVLPKPHKKKRHYE